MAAQYPSALVSGTQMPTRSDTTAVTTNHAADHNQAAFELIAIEAELGLLPKGPYADVATRLNKVANTSEDDKIRRAISTTTTPTFVAQTLDPSNLTSATDIIMSDQRMGGGIVILEEDVTGVVGVAFRVSTAGVGVTYSNFCGVVLWSIDPTTFAWTRVALSANQRSGGACGVFDTNGFKQVAFTGTVNLTKGTMYLVTTLGDSSAGTRSHLMGQGAQCINDFSDPNVGRFMALAGQTSVPAGPITASTTVNITNAHWLALYK